tara:strand:+ start:6464 stop:7600 length:1137 start_codon:yes stop_codon:yes gene_type:complete
MLYQQELKRQVKGFPIDINRLILSKEFQRRFLMLKRRSFIKAAFLGAVPFFIPSFLEAKILSIYHSLPSKSIEDHCFRVLCNSLTRDTYYANKFEIIRAFVEIGNNDCSSLIFNQLEKTDPTNNNELIAFYLAKLGDKRGIEYLQNSLSSNDCIIQRDARDFLNALNGLNTFKVISGIQKCNEELIRDIQEDSDTVDRFEAIRQIVKSNDKVFLPYLRDVLWDPLAGSDVAVAMYKIGDPAIMSFLIKSAEGKNNWESAYAISALSEIGDNVAISTFKKILKIENSDNREYIACNLSEGSYSKEIKQYLLNNYLYDENRDVQTHAAIGYYYNRNDSIREHYRRHDTSLKNSLIFHKLVPCAKDEMRCDKTKCHFFKKT